MSSPILLRYFDCRGRAQPLRHYLAHMGTEFVDERVPFDDGYATWARLKSDASMSGPFGKLPVLHWQGRLYAETTVISALVQDFTDPSEQASLIAQTQSALSDDLGELYRLLNLDLLAPGANARRVGERVTSHLAVAFRRYDALATSADDPFSAPLGPSVATFWLHEVWEVARLLLGASSGSLVEGLERLPSALARISSLPCVKGPDVPTPGFWSARPDEPKRLAELRKEIG